MSKLWIWWPDTAKHKNHITHDQVHLAPNKAYGFVHKAGARKAAVIPATRLFETKEQAEQAMTQGGKLAWSFRISQYSCKQGDNSGKVIRVRVADSSALQIHLVGRAKPASGIRTFVQPVDDKDRPAGQGFTGPVYWTKDDALWDLAELVCDMQEQVDREMSEASKLQAFLKWVAKEIDADGISVPTPVQLRKRRADRRRRQRKEMK